MNQTIPAYAGETCYCCGRTHRKLYMIDGYWLGRNCADDYQNYKRDSNRSAAMWRGWEEKFDKVYQMVHGKEWGLS